MRKEREKEFIKRGGMPAASCTKAEIKTYDQFFRGDHPDKRTNEQFLRDMSMKQVEKKLHSGKWYPLKVGNRAKAVICLTTKKQYVTIQDAADDMNVSLTRMWRHLKGYELYSHINGNKFEYL